MNFILKRLPMLAVSLILLTTCVSAPAQGGTQSSPLVSKSFIDEEFVPSVLKSAREKADAAFGTRYASAAAGLDALAKNPDKKSLEVTAERISNRLVGAASLTLKKGQTLYGEPGTIVVVLSGTLKVGKNPVVDLTAGNELEPGAQSRINRSYLITEMSGSSLVVSSETAKIVSRSTLKITSAYVPVHKDAADVLSKLGLFKGTTKGFELERPASRIEGLIMLIRLSGADKAALETDPKLNPFGDVPVWPGAQAERYVAYGYEQNLTRGVSITRFNPNSAVSPEQYTTFILRCLGYSDKSAGNGDFEWDKSLQFAQSIGLVDDSDITEFKREFMRDQVVYISCLALGTKMKGSSETLIDKLIASGAVDSRNAEDLAVFW